MPSTAPASTDETATDGPQPTTTAIAPVTVAAVTNGAESRFAIGDMRGTVPKWSSSTGTTATCAAVAAPSVAHSAFGRRSGEHARSDHDADGRGNRELEANVNGQLAAHNQQQGYGDPDCDPCVDHNAG